MRSTLNSSVVSCLGIDHPRRKTIPLWNSLGKEWVCQGINVCLVSTILGIVWCPGSFQSQVLVFFYRHSARMYFRKEKEGGPIPQEMATQARQAFRQHYLCFAISCRPSELLSSEWGLQQQKILCVFLQIKDIKHIKQDFCSDVWVMPQGTRLGCAGAHFFNMVMWYIILTEMLSRTECK